MRHGFRTRVWRELPFSARRAILGTFRTVDRIEDWIVETWRSLHRSPAWIFVAVAGTVGIVLTILLFLTLSQQLMAAGSQGRQVRGAIIEPEVPLMTPRDAIDSRLCLDDVPKSEPHYAADFAFADDRTWAQTTPRATIRDRRVRETSEDSKDFGSPAEQPRPRTTSRTPPIVDDTDPFTDFAPRTPSGKPDLQPDVQFLRQRLPSASSRDRVKVLGRSSAPISQTVELDLVPHRPDGWSLSADRELALSTRPQRYQGDTEELAGQVIGVHATDDDAFADAGAWGPRAEVAFRVELQVPERAAPSQPGRSSLVIRNLGTEMIRRLQVAESMRSLDVVTAAMPGGQVQDDLLLREVQRLRTGREKTLSVDWLPVSMTERRHEARILAEAFVAATVDVSAAQEPAPETEVEPPLPPSPIKMRQARQPPPAETEPVRELPPVPTDVPPRRSRRQPAVECTVRGGGTVRAGEVAEVAVEVRNSGDTILHNVRIWVDLPAALQHRNGPQLECLVERLSPGKSHVATLRVIGGQPGNAVANIRVQADEPVNAAAAARVAVVNGSAASSARPRAASSPRAASQANPCCGCDCGPQVLWIGAAF